MPINTQTFYNTARLFLNELFLQLILFCLLMSVVHLFSCSTVVFISSLVSISLLIFSLLFSYSFYFFLPLLCLIFFSYFILAFLNSLNAVLCPNLALSSPGLTSSGLTSSNIYLPGATVEFTCDPIRKRFGPASITCRNGGTWTSAPPIYQLDTL